MSRPVMMVPDDAVARRAERHAALGEPVRLAIVESLQLTDLTPQDIVRGMGIRSNLLAHHLNVLEAAGIVERIRSQGDGRRRYLQLVVDAVRHLQLTTPSVSATSVLFVCVEDLGLSQIAARLFAERATIPANAATHLPAHVAAASRDLALRQGLGQLMTAPRAIVDLDATDVPDLIVTVNDRARETAELPLSNGSALLHWSTPRPDSEQGLMHAVANITRRIEVLIGALNT